MTQIHPYAVVDPSAELGEEVVVGPYAIIEPDVQIGRGCVIAAHAVIKSGTSLGTGNRVHEHAVLGGIPQHLHLGQEMGRLRIGDDNIFRENCTVHRAWKPGSETLLGSRNMVMINAHIAHDCSIGDETIMANNVMLAGHVEVGSRAYISGAVGVHQFCRIGRQTMVGGQARITRDVPPFTMIDGETSCVVGLNLIGLRRAGFTTPEIRELKEAFRTIYRRQMPQTELLAALDSQFPDGPAGEFAPFLRGSSKRGYCQMRRRETARPEREKDPARAFTVRFPDQEAA